MKDSTTADAATMSMKPGPQDALTLAGHAFMALQTGVGWPCPRR
jgi:hypothetical protein